MDFLPVGKYTHTEYTLNFLFFTLSCWHTPQLKWLTKRKFPSNWKWVKNPEPTSGEREKMKIPKRKPATAILVDDKIVVCLWSPRLNETRLFTRRAARFIVPVEQQHMPSGAGAVEPPGGNKIQLIATSELGATWVRRFGIPAEQDRTVVAFKSSRREALAWYYYSRPETGITIHVTVARSINCSTTTAASPLTKNVSIHQPNHTHKPYFFEANKLGSCSWHLFLSWYYSADLADHIGILCRAVLMGG